MIFLSFYKEIDTIVWDVLNMNYIILVFHDNVLLRKSVTSDRCKMKSLGMITILILQVKLFQVTDLC